MRLCLHSQAMPKTEGTVMGSELPLMKANNDIGRIQALEWQA